jgi:hypothetical protein
MCKVQGIQGDEIVLCRGRRLEACLRVITDDVMRPKPIVDQNSRLVIRSGSSQRVKHVLHPVQADLCIGVTSLRTRKVPSRSWVGGPGAPMCGSRPDNQWG